MGAAKMVDAIVAPGRSVHADLTKYQVFNAEKNAMVDAWRLGKAVGPGGKVSLPQDEVERLQGLGFLVKPGVAALATANGPTFGTTEGPSITEPA